MNSVAIPAGVAGYRLAVVGQDVVVVAVDSASVRSSAAAADEGDGSVGHRNCPTVGS